MSTWFRRDVAMNVAYEDRTPTGSPVTQRPDEAVRLGFAPLLAAIEGNGVAAAVDDHEALLAACLASDGFGLLAVPDGAGAWSARGPTLRPDVELARPRWLTVARPDVEDAVVRAALPADYWPPVHDVLVALSTTGLAGELRAGLPDELAAWVTELEARGLCTDEAPGRPELAELVFAGHNAVVVSTERARVVVDPFLPAGSERYGDYQPLQPAELAPLDAVVVTHSHPDHFAPASLLRIDRDTRIVVPAVPAETILAVDMERRCRELGFTDVVAVEPGDCVEIGDIAVDVLAFHGEQPTAGARLHPEVRNAGCTYVLRTPGWSAAVCADAGVDAEGSMAEVARAHRRARGPVDVVFCGYRGWVTYPAQLLISSVARYALFVPPESWGTRQRLMSDPDDALDVAEAFGARVLVPYADGGAPWHWELGLGPRLDGTGEEVPGFDPFPERVIDAAARRAHAPDGSWLTSPTDVVVLRPGDAFTDVAGTPSVVRTAGHAWPW